ncbi:hypothetical protein ACOMHN_059526 [Nucella lapillus]
MQRNVTAAVRAREYGFPVPLICTLASRAVDRVTDREWYSDHHQACPLYVMLKELVARVPPVSRIIWTQTDLWEQEDEELQSIFILCVELCRQLQDRAELRPLADVIEELQSCD